MKTAFQTLFFSLLTISISSCNKEDVRPEPNNKLEIQFENVGSEKIKNFKFQGKSIGDIKENSTTKYYTFKSIKLVGNQVMEEASVKSDWGKIENWVSTNEDLNWNTLNSGRHTIQLFLYYGCGVGFGLNLVD